jgi:hypothetical protein
VLFGQSLTTQVVDTEGDSQTVQHVPSETRIPPPLFMGVVLGESGGSATGTTTWMSNRLTAMWEYVVCCTILAVTVTARTW